MEQRQNTPLLEVNDISVTFRMYSGALEQENLKLRADLERDEARIRELLLQRTELLKALRSSNNCIRRLTASVRDLSRDLRCSHQLCAQMLRKNIKKRPSFPYAGLGRFLGSLTGRFRKGH